MGANAVVAYLRHAAISSGPKVRLGTNCGKGGDGWGVGSRSGYGYRWGWGWGWG